MHNLVNSRIQTSTSLQQINCAKSEVGALAAEGKVELARRVLEINLRLFNEQGMLYDAAMLAVKPCQPLLAAELLEEAGASCSIARKFILYKEARDLYKEANDSEGAVRMEGRLAACAANSRDATWHGIFTSLVGIFRKYGSLEGNRARTAARRWKRDA